TPPCCRISESIISKASISASRSLTPNGVNDRFLIFPFLFLIPLRPRLSRSRFAPAPVSATLARAAHCAVARRAAPLRPLGRANAREGGGGSFALAAGRRAKCAARVK